ncbi:hypothetical protein BU24DRAFT_429442 [Aaosphaeria arxii CBS 175.79]|uniref:Uncharacterized protein n=1 Tax=Aaosphaeria arxii CBS 175.79 TaxID=1450172 RepID=A0A6A5X645_9PLEO|nr:uncharacterized protein BU24DRAFT_429442 [Aaosphaeria arxii CBS 175.79]KAF2008341.1 hypothetical protein BU24DRAFT_429442 [Aaosphaeria arxii CBS 175.79]
MSIATYVWKWCKAGLKWLFPSTEMAQHHAAIWDSIFKDNGKWLDYAVNIHNIQPMILGKDLDTLDGEMGRGAYVLLLLLDVHENVRNELDKFIASLHDHVKDARTNELRFRKFNMRVVGLKGDQTTISQHELRRLVAPSRWFSGLNTVYSSWAVKDVRSLGLTRNNIRGVHTRVVDFGDLEPVFSVRLFPSLVENPVQMHFQVKVPERAWNAVYSGPYTDEMQDRDFYNGPLVSHWEMAEAAMDRRVDNDI